MKIPVAKRRWVVTLAHAARATSGSSSLCRRIDDRARVVLVGRVAGGRVLAPVVGRQHDVLTEPQRFESGLVGGCRQLHELGAGDVVDRQPDAHASSADSAGLSASHVASAVASMSRRSVLGHVGTDVGTMSSVRDC